jgi:hypothetical protein
MVSRTLQAMQTRTTQRYGRVAHYQRRKQDLPNDLRHQNPVLAWIPMQ